MYKCHFLFFHSTLIDFFWSQQHLSKQKNWGRVASPRGGQGNIVKTVNTSVNATEILVNVQQLHGWEHATGHDSKIPRL